MATSYPQPQPQIFHGGVRQIQTTVPLHLPSYATNISITVPISLHYGMLHIAWRCSCCLRLVALHALWSASDWRENAPEHNGFGSLSWATMRAHLHRHTPSPYLRLATGSSYLFEPFFDAKAAPAVPDETCGRCVAMAPPTK